MHVEIQVPTEALAESADTITGIPATDGSATESADVKMTNLEMGNENVNEPFTSVDPSENADQSTETLLSVDPMFIFDIAFSDFLEFLMIPLHCYTVFTFEVHNFPNASFYAKLAYILGIVSFCKECGFVAGLVFFAAYHALKKLSPTQSKNSQFCGLVVSKGPKALYVALNASCLGIITLFVVFEWLLTGVNNIYGRHYKVDSKYSYNHWSVTYLLIQITQFTVMTLIGATIGSVLSTWAWLQKYREKNFIVAYLVQCEINRAPMKTEIAKLMFGIPIFAFCVFLLGLFIVNPFF
jgi:hypothetical protein